MTAHVAFTSPLSNAARDLIAACVESLGYSVDKLALAA